MDDQKIEEMLAANDHNEMLAHLMERMAKVEKRLDALESPDDKAKGKK